MRELAWIIGSRPLMTEHGYRGIYQTLDDTWFDDLLEESTSVLESLDEDPTELEHWLEDRNTKLLGIRFESFLGFLFHIHPRFDILASNVQLKGDVRTIGELDFIIRDLTHDRVLHLEVACKFYLSSKNSPQWNLWVGPNPNDTLKLKMDKLVDQLAATTTRQGQDFLQANLISRPEPALLMKGSFHHHFSNITRAKHPKFSNAKYNSGWWCHQRELGELDNPHLRWAELEKESWLCPQVRSFSETLDFQSVLDIVGNHFSRSKRSILLTCLIEEEGIWVEHSRGFVVRDKWPD